MEAIVRQRDKEKTAHAVAKLSSESGSGDKTKGVPMADENMENDVFETNGISDISDAEGYDENDTAISELSPEHKVAAVKPVQSMENEDLTAPEQMEVELEEKGVATNVSSPSESSYETVTNDFIDMDPNMIPSPMESTSCHAVIVTKASIDITAAPEVEIQLGPGNELSPLAEENNGISLDALQEPKSNCVSPASSNGGIYSVSFR